MQMLIYLVIGIIIGYVLARSTGSGFGEKENNPAPTFPSEGEGNKPINPEQIKQKQEHLEKVMEMAKSQAEITNDQVEKALGVSDKTAERYLQELEEQGKLEQLGERGRQVAYKIK